MKLRTVLFVAVVGAAACDSSTAPPLSVAPPVPLTPPAAPVVVNIIPVTPIHLTGMVATEVTAPAVRATDENGKPVMGAQIRFMAGGRNGVIANGSIQTDSNGIASAGLWMLAPTAGTQIVIALFNDDVRARFTATATAGPIAEITRLSGHGNVVVAGSEIKPMQVRVSDVFSNPIAGALVTFTVTAGTGLVAGWEPDRSPLGDGRGLPSPSFALLGGEGFTIAANGWHPAWKA